MRANSLAIPFGPGGASEQACRPIFDRHRPPKVIPLKIRAPLRLQEGGLLTRLDAFGDHLDSERSTQPENRAHDRFAIGSGHEATNKGLIDLDLLTLIPTWAIRNGRTQKNHKDTAPRTKRESPRRARAFSEWLSTQANPRLGITAPFWRSSCAADASRSPRRSCRRLPP